MYYFFPYFQSNAINPTQNYPKKDNELEKIWHKLQRKR